MYLTSFSTLNVMVNTILILLVFELALLSTWTYLFIGLGGYYNLRNLLSFIQIATCRGEILFLEFVSLAIYVAIVHFFILDIVLAIIFWKQPKDEDDLEPE